MTYQLSVLSIPEFRTVDEKRLAVNFIKLNVSTILLKIVTLFYIIWACPRPVQYFY